LKDAASTAELMGEEDGSKVQVGEELQRVVLGRFPAFSGRKITKVASRYVSIKGLCNPLIDAFMHCPLI
jgi:hypothetical protein